MIVFWIPFWWLIDFWRRTTLASTGSSVPSGVDDCLHISGIELCWVSSSTSMAYFLRSVTQINDGGAIVHYDNACPARTDALGIVALLEYLAVSLDVQTALGFTWTSRRIHDHLRFLRNLLWHTVRGHHVYVPLGLRIHLVRCHPPRPFLRIPPPPPLPPPPRWIVRRHRLPLLPPPSRWIVRRHRL